MITIEINYGGDTYHFTDDYCKGDIINITCSDYCHELVATEEQLVALGLAVIDNEVDGGIVYWSDENVPFLFSNEMCDEVIMSVGIDNYGQCKRPEDTAAIYG